MSAEKSLSLFMELHTVPRADLYIYQATRNGKPWYVVIYGQYKSIQAARSAAKNLPDTLANMDSWAKKYQSVQQELQR